MNPYRSARRLAAKIIGAVPWLRRLRYASTDYRVITEARARASRADGWFSSFTAWRQERAYKALLADMRAGHPRADLVIAAQAVDAVGLKQASLLEIGCGSGYYSEILAALPATSVAYSGIDYSHAMVALAQKRYPQSPFRQEDATALGFSDASFDIVFNGVSLMHILDYRAAISESRRVARHACIFHCVPVFAERQTTYISKYAYGAQVVEIVFNRDEILRCFEEVGLQVVRSWQGPTYDLHDVIGEHSVAETFLCVPGGSKANS